MVGDGRKRLSGHQYKQSRDVKRQKLDEVLRKTPKIDSFLISSKEKPSIPTDVNDNQSTSNQCKSTEDKRADSEVENENVTIQMECDSTPIIETEITSESDTRKELHESADGNENSENDPFINLDRNDPITWIFTAENGEKQIDYILSAPIKQDLNADFSNSARIYKKSGDKLKTRYANKNMFFSVLPNGEKTLRDWLLYSESIGKVFCVPCKIFHKNDGDSTTNLIHEGFNDWKNAKTLLSSHERSIKHRENTFTYIQRLSKLMKIDSDLRSQLEKEKLYWTTLAERLIHVIKFLSIRGLPFRGSDENLGSVQNGNYLGLIELLAEYDEFLKNHLEKFGNPGKGNTSYLSHGICDELINLVGEKVRTTVIDEINKAKYYTLILDSTPDCAHVDQLTVIIRFINVNGDPVERFLTFIPIQSHKAMSLEATIVEFLTKAGIPIEKCRGQCYDNANNMSGVHNGLQALIKRQNKFADYIPCAAHSLNLVGTSAAESCNAANDYFMFLQSLYNFFSGSTTNRWTVLMNAIEQANEKLSKNDRIPTVKNLSQTRWAARYDASSALLKGYKLIANCLNEISEDDLLNQATRQEAKSLGQKLFENRTAFMLVFWTDVLDKMNRASKNLQKVSLDLATAVKLYQSMKDYFSTMRDTRFEEFLQKSEELTGEKWDQWSKKELKKRKPIKKLPFGEKKDETTFTPLQSLRIESFNVIIDELIAALDQREKGYLSIHDRFGFLFKLAEMNNEDIKKCATNLSSYYSEDLDLGLIEECFHFKEYTKENKFENAAQMLKDIHVRNLILIFPNIYVALKIFVTLPISNASGERSFSTLKRVKNFLRSIMSQEKLTSFAIMTIEPDVTKEVPTSDIIEKFATLKSRRKTF